jgi:biopolymer transport protein ExbD
MDELGARFTTAAQKTPQPELQLRADKSTRYEVIAQVMSSAQTNGMTKIGFVTNPKDVSR